MKGSDFGDSSEDDEQEIIYMQTDNLQVFQELTDIGIPTTPSTSKAPNPVILFHDDLGAGPSARQPSSIIPVIHTSSSSMDEDDMPPGDARGCGQ